MEYENLLGAIIFRTKGLVKHFGVCLGDGYVIHCHPNDGVKVVSYQEFAIGYPVSLKEHPIVTRAEINNRLKRLLAGEPNYRIFSNNCEHVAYYLVKGFKESPQLRNALLGGALGVVIGLTREENVLPWAASGALFGLSLSG